MNVHLKRSKKTQARATNTLADFLRECPLQEAPDAMSYQDSQGTTQVVHVFSDDKERKYCLHLSDPVEIGIQPLEQVEVLPGSVEPLHMEMVVVSLDKAPQASRGIRELVSAL